MTKPAEIQEAILGLNPKDQQIFWAWRDRAALDLEKGTPELEAGLLEAVEEPSFTPYSPQTMRAICERVAAEMRLGCRLDAKRQSDKGVRHDNDPP